MPLILGLMPISAKNGVIETERGKECLTFPGPGGYKIEWPPGTVRIPLEKAMSNHLMTSCCNYDRVPKQTGGVKAPPPPVLFTTTEAGGYEKYLQREEPLQTTKPPGVGVDKPKDSSCNGAADAPPEHP